MNVERKGLVIYAVSSLIWFGFALAVLPLMVEFGPLALFLSWPTVARIDDGGIFVIYNTLRLSGTGFYIYILLVLAWGVVAIKAVTYMRIGWLVMRVGEIARKFGVEVEKVRVRTKR